MSVFSPWFSDFQSADQEHTKSTIKTTVTWSPPQSHHPLCSVDRATAPVLQHILYPSYTALLKLPAVITSKIRKSTSTKLTYAHDTWHIHTHAHIYVFLFGTEHPQVTSAKSFFFSFIQTQTQESGHSRDITDIMTKWQSVNFLPHVHTQYAHTRMDREFLTQ